MISARRPVRRGPGFEVPGEAGDVVAIEAGERCRPRERSPHAPSVASSRTWALDDRVGVEQPPVERVVDGPLDDLDVVGLEDDPLAEPGDEAFGVRVRGQREAAGAAHRWREDGAMRSAG